jgi:hypothetical protein
LQLPQAPDARPPLELLHARAAHNLHSHSNPQLLLLLLLQLVLLRACNDCGPNNRHHAALFNSQKIGTGTTWPQPLTPATKG